MNELEKRVLELTIQFRIAFLDYHECIRGGEEKNYDWYLRKVPKKRRLNAATTELENVTDALIKERSKP